MLLEELLHTPHAGIEALYAGAPLAPPPRGVYRGRFLCWAGSRASRRLAVRALQTVLFRLPPFGIDFDARAWFFFAPRLRAGRFEMRRGPSRWRDAEVYALHYHPSRLPGVVRNVLYDEVKPLDESLGLGLGGINAERGEGDHFFFALSR